MPQHPRSSGMLFPERIGDILYRVRGIGPRAVFPRRGGALDI
jgi:hypothetical protein